MTQTIDRSSYAGFWTRLIALLVDGVVLLIPGAILQAGAPIIGSAASVFLGFFYTTIFNASALQGTIGKKVLDIRVTDMNGQRISYRASVVRYFSSWISGLIFCVGYIMGAFTERKQTLHDMIAGTVVLNGSFDLSPIDTFVAQTRALVDSVPNPSTAPTAEALETIQKLQALKDSGALTQEEFEAQKKKILG
jgi:uncharacterized RDD family membrane protein YckC